MDLLRLPSSWPAAPSSRLPAPSSLPHSERAAPHSGPAAPHSGPAALHRDAEVEMQVLRQGQKKKRNNASAAYKRRIEKGSVCLLA